LTLAFRLLPSTAAAPRVRVRDPVVACRTDCCDGSDEYNGVKVCEDRCAEEGREIKEALMKKIHMQEEVRPRRHATRAEAACRRGGAQRNDTQQGSSRLCEPSLRGDAADRAGGGRVSRSAPSTSSAPPTSKTACRGARCASPCR
jgi:hypothetical protein